MAYTQMVENLLSVDCFYYVYLLVDKSMATLKLKLKKLDSRDYVFDFGKYKGKPASFVLVYDPWYILWLRDNEVMEIDQKMYEDAMTSAFDDVIDRMDWGIDPYDWDD